MFFKNYLLVLSLQCCFTLQEVTACTHQADMEDSFCRKCHIFMHLHLCGKSHLCRIWCKVPAWYIGTMCIILVT